MNLEDYTQRPLEEEGVFRAFPVAWTIEPSKTQDSQSVAIAFRFAIHQKWHGKEQGWSMEWPAGYFTDNRTYVVKRDGTVNQGAVEALGKAGLWDGDWDKLQGPVPSVFVLVDVGAETDPTSGKVRHRANWVNPNADEPQARGGFTPADSSLVSNLRARFQSKTRAIAGGNASGAPPAPPPQPQPAAAAAPAQPAAPPRQSPREPSAPTAAPAAPGARPGPTPAIAAPQAPPPAKPPLAPAGPPAVGQPAQPWRPPSMPMGAPEPEFPAVDVDDVPF